MNLVRKDLMARGTHSEVYRFLLNGEPVAGKVSKLQCVKKEMGVLLSLNHPNIVNVIDTVEDGDEFIILQEIYTPFPEWRRTNTCIGNSGFRRLILQLKNGVEYIHLNGLIHCDVKSNNLLVDRQGDLKLSDFSSVCKFDERGKKLPSFTESHCAWEILNGDTWDERIDLWAMGCCIFEMVYNRLIFCPTLVSRHGKLCKNKINSYNNTLYFWAIYSGELAPGEVKFIKSTFQKAEVPVGMKNSKIFHDVAILSLLKVYPENRKSLSEIFVENF